MIIIYEMQKCCGMFQKFDTANSEKERINATTELF